jgi:hypothetical protein
VKADIEKAAVAYVDITEIRDGKLAVYKFALVELGRGEVAALKTAAFKYNLRKLRAASIQIAKGF